MIPVKWQQHLILIQMILQNYLKMTLDLSTPLNNDTRILTFKEVNDSKINDYFSHQWFKGKGCIADGHSIY